MKKDFKQILWILYIFLIIITVIVADSAEDEYGDEDSVNDYDDENDIGDLISAQHLNITPVLPINAKPKSTTAKTTSLKSTTRKPTTTHRPSTQKLTTLEPVTFTTSLKSTATSSSRSTTRLSSSSIPTSTLTSGSSNNLTASPNTGSTFHSPTTSSPLIPPETISSTSTSIKSTTTDSITSSTTIKSTTPTTTKPPWIPPPNPPPPYHPPPQRPTQEPEPEPYIPPPYVPPPTDDPISSQSEESSKSLLIGLAIGIPIFLIILCLILCLVLWCYKRNKNSQAKANPNKKNEIPLQQITIQPTKVKSNQNLEKAPPPPPPPPVAKTPNERYFEKPVAVSSSPSVPQIRPKTKYYQDSDHASFSSVPERKGLADGFVIDPTQNLSDMAKDENNVEPDHIPAQSFVYKGPLVLKKYNNVELHHDLENQSERKVLSNEHVTWDDQHVVHEMGSEVEILISNRSKASQKEGVVKTELETDETDAKSSKKDNS